MASQLEVASGRKCVVSGSSNSPCNALGLTEGQGKVPAAGNTRCLGHQAAPGSRGRSGIRHVDASIHTLGVAGSVAASGVRRKRGVLVWHFKLRTEAKGRTLPCQKACLFLGN